MRLELLFLGFIAVGQCDDIRLVVHRTNDPTGAYPASGLYTVMIRNGGAVPVKLSLIQMPGGYVGSGAFYNCSIEEWRPKRRDWITARRTEAYPSPAVRQVLVAPGEEREICREMLPAPSGSLPASLGHPGSCMRFRLTRDWSTRSDSWISRSFVVGDVSVSRECP